MSVSDTFDLSVSDTTMKKSKTKEEDEAEGLERLVKIFKDRVSSLRMKKCWNTYLYNYQGFWYHSGFACCVEGVMASQDSFKVRSTDIVLATIPKCGTTWLKALAFAIISRTKYKNDSNHPLCLGNPHDYVPFVEVQLVFRENHAPDYIETTEPQLLATHTPYQSLPESFHGAGCRIVYIYRDPKDAFISYWFFKKKLEHISPNQNMTMTFDESFDFFCKGISPCGSFWDHVLGYYKASLERPDKVLFLKYQDMKKDTVSHLKRLAEFLNQPFTSKEEDEGVVEEIVELCSFEKMKNLEVNKTGFHRKLCSNEVFFREGKVGDFANHLTPEMITLMDNTTKEKFHGYDLLF